MKPSRKILCNYQQGQLSLKQISLLEKALNAEYSNLFGNNQRLVVAWVEVPKGQGFTDAKPSQAAWISIEVADGLEQKLREKALKRVSDIWVGITNTDPYDMMIAMMDSSSMSEYMQAMDARLATAGRLRIKLWMVRHALQSKLRKGHIMLNANFGS